MTPGLRVLYLAPPSPKAGRLSRYSFLDEEIRALADRGIHAYVLSRDGDAASDDGHVHVRVLPDDSAEERRKTLTFLARHFTRIPFRNLVDVRQVYRSVRVERFAADLIARESISLIHSYFGWPRGFGGQLAAAATGVPLVAGVRGSDVNTIAELDYGARLNPSFDRAIRRLLKNADRTIFVSDFLKRQGLALGARGEVAQVVMKGVRLDHFTVNVDRQAAKESVGSGNAPMILAVGGLVKIKGLHHVLEALAIVKASGRAFSFVVCGEGDERDALAQQAKSLGLAECLTLSGKVPRDRIASYFAAADLFVHGSIIEASGNVLLEAMASGLPIVCTDAGGPGEYVKHGSTGFVVPVADPQSMASQILRLLDDAGLRQQFGASGRALALRAYGYDRMIDETVDAYQRVLQAAAVPAGPAAKHELRPISGAGPRNPTI